MAKTSSRTWLPVAALMAAGSLLVIAMYFSSGGRIGVSRFGVWPGGNLALIASPKTAADLIVNGAKMQANKGVTYDASYAQMSYPGGDVPGQHGACTDVIVRAERNAGVDFQKLIHEDMRSHWGRYPHH